MINLVPPTAKKNIVKEYWVRVVSAWLFLLSVVLLFVSAFLLPVNILLSGQVSAYQTSADEVTAKIAEYDLSSQELVLANKQALKLLELNKAELFSDVVSQVRGLDGSGVEFIGFEFGREENMKLESVTVKGEAKTRQELSDFRDSLLTLPGVIDADLPISNLAQNQDITFSLTLTLDGGNEKKK